MSQGLTNRTPSCLHPGSLIHVSDWSVQGTGSTSQHYALGVLDLLPSSSLNCPARAPELYFPMWLVPTCTTGASTSLSTRLFGERHAIGAYGSCRHPPHKTIPPLHTHTHKRELHFAVIVKTSNRLLMRTKIPNKRGGGGAYIMPGKFCVCFPILNSLQNPAAWLWS